METKLSEFELSPFDLTEIENYNLMKQLYRDLLVKDDWWHFFAEGPDALLRIESDLIHEDRVAKWLEKHNIKFKHGWNWEDNIVTTRKYQDVFIYTFHANSVLAMRLESYEELLLIADRITHCFLNNVRNPEFVEKLNDFTYHKSDKYIFWESMILSFMAAQRTYILGFRKGYKEASQ